MNIEEMLADELRTVAGDVTVPPPPVADLVTRGERARSRNRSRRRSYVAGLAAAAAVAVGAGFVLADGDPRSQDAPPADPSPSDASPTATGRPTELEVGPDPGLPWVDRDGVLHLDADTALGGSYEDVTGREPWISALTVDEFAWVDVVDGVPTAPSESVREPWSVSPDGRWAARIRVGADGYEIVLRDAEDPARERVHDLGLIDYQGGDEGATALHGVDDRGRVYFGSLLESTMWVGSGDATVALERAPGQPWQLNGVGPDGPVLSPGPGADPFLAVLADDGTITGRTDMPNVVDDHLSPDGTRTAWLTDARGRDVQSDGAYEGVVDAVTMQVLATGERTTLALPPGTDLRGIRWETADRVLLPVALDEVGQVTRLARCDFGTGRCEWAGQG